MRSKNENLHQEEKLLQESCKNKLNEIKLIKDLLAIQQKKTLLIKKRGLNSDIENCLETFIEETK